MQKNNHAYNQKPGTGHKGFTLIELMVVIAIMGIMAGFTILSMLNPDSRVKKVARELMGDIQAVKMAAAKNNQSWSIAFAGTGYTIRNSGGGVVKTVAFRTHAEGVVYGTGSATQTPDGGALNDPDAIYYLDDLMNEDDTLTFLPNGTAEDGWVYLTYRDATYAVGTLSTGLVRLRRWTGGGWQ